jgi:hypothetical protein
MAQFSKSNNPIHDAVCNAAESTRQVTVAAAAQSLAGQVTVNNAEITWARACIASCKANNNSQGMEAYIDVLRSLGVNA